MAMSENWSLNHVANVICAEKNQQSWSEMEFVRVFAHESQEPILRASFQPIPSRTKRWPSKKATYSRGLTYVRLTAVLPATSVCAAAAQATSAVPADKRLAYSCCGCGETSHRREECTFLTHVCGGCKRADHLEAVCWKCQPQLAPRWFVDKLGRGDAVSQALPHVKGCDRDAATSSRSASESAIRRDFNAGKLRQGKGRQEHYAKTAHMTTVALNDNLNC